MTHRPSFPTTNSPKGTTTVKAIIRILVALAAVAGIGVTTVDAFADGGVKQNRAETPVVEDADLRPQANCPGTNVYVVYNQPTGCDVNPPQKLHLIYLPSSWTLAQAHTFCADAGAVGAFTRYNGIANVCPDVDY